MSFDDNDAPKNTHRTIDRVTRIIEEVVYRPGITFSELVRTLDAAKSSVHGFIRGLIAKGWLFEDDGRFYLGPVVYGLTMASGHIRAGLVTHEDLADLHNETGAAVFVGVQAGDHLIYVAEQGSDPVIGFDARTNIRRALLATAGGKALLAAQPGGERESYMRRMRAAQPELVAHFLEELEEIQRTGLATNTRQGGRRFAIATALLDQSDAVIASITLVGPTSLLQDRARVLGDILLKRADEYRRRQQRRTELDD